MARTRSEYRLRPLADLPPLAAPPTAPDLVTRPPVAADRDALSALMLNAYRGTVDDEGEGPEEALEAIDHYLGRIEAEWSRIAVEDGTPYGMCFVVVVDDLLYIDPIAVAAERKSQGIGRGLVHSVLTSMGQGGVPEVGATITDGNVPSERLFTSLGFTRLGGWPPA